VVTGVAVAVLLVAPAVVAGPPEQRKAKLPYDAGVARLEVVDESQPFDPLHGIMVHPRILVGAVYYPIRRGAGGSTPINLSYYHDAPEDESYSRTFGWGFGIPSMYADAFLNDYDSSIEDHLDTERSGIYAEAPIAWGRFPVVIQLNGAGGRGHQADDIGGEFARRGYIYVALDAPGVSSLTPIGRVSLEPYPDLATALGGLPLCEPTSDGRPPLCFNPGPGEYGVADDGGIVWGSGDLWETYEVQRARDAVAMLEKVKKMLRWRADTRRVGILGISLGGPPTFVAPQLIDALRGLRGDRFAAYGIVPSPFAVNWVGEDVLGYPFGSQIGAILCQGVPDCEPIEAARRLDFPVGIHIAEEDWLITGFPYSESAEWTFYNTYPSHGFPGYGPGLTPEPSPENRSPANRIFFESVSEGVPALWVQVPDSSHLSWNSNPLMRWFDDNVLEPPIQVFAPYGLYEPLPMELQQEILVHYAAAFFDLTLKGRKWSALGALKTDRYENVTPDGRGVTVETRSLEACRR
jgi:hypothetical protein